MPNGIYIGSTDGTHSANLTFTGTADKTIDADNLDKMIGVGQTWQNVAASRSIGTTFTNTSGKPILVAVTYTCSAANSVQGLTISGSTVYAGAVDIINGAGGFSIMVPNGATYVTATNLGTLTMVAWSELR